MALQLGDQPGVSDKLFAQGSLGMDQRPEPKSLWYGPKGLALDY